MTYSITEARSRAARYAAKVLGAFDMIKTYETTISDVRKLIKECFIGLIQEAEKRGGYLATTDEPDQEIEEQRELSRDHIRELRTRLGTQTVDVTVRRRTEELVAQHGLVLNGLAAARKTDLFDGVARALIEQQNLFLLRLDDRLAEFHPTDTLFTNISHGVPMSSAPPSAHRPDFGTPSAPKGPTIGDAVAAYLAAQAKVWKPRTLKARRWQLRYLVEFLGETRPLVSVMPADIRAFRDQVLSLRANHGRSPSHSFAEKQTESLKVRIKGKTAVLIFEPTKAFMRWAKSHEGLIDKNPAEDVQIAIPKSPKGERSRRPFEPHEIIQLFSSPLFTGCKSVHRRFEAGDKLVRDGKFWLPILGYYTGCRLGELVQLALQDIKIDGENPHLDINEKSLSGGDSKSVKSEAGIRCVPLHPDLLKLGFAEFVVKRCKHDKPAIRLFKEIKYGCDGQASTEFSKFFARLMEKVGLTDPQLVFHSWRHGIEDALRDAGIQPYTIDRIVGHADATMGGKYGKGVSLPVLHDAVAAMKLPLSLPDLIGLGK